MNVEAFFNPVPEKARFIADYVVVTNGEGSAVNTAPARILFFGDIFPPLVENRKKLNMIARDCFMFTQEGLRWSSPVTDPFFKGGRQGTFILLSILSAKLTIRVVFFSSDPN